MAPEPWKTESVEGSKFFDTSIPGLAERIRIFAKANDVPTVGAEEALKTLAGPGGPFELEERNILTDDGTTKAPHLKGPTGAGQKYRVFKTGPQVLGDLYALAAKNFNKTPFIVYKGPDAAGGAERYSYAEAYETACGLAAFLMEELGVKKGDRVMQCSRNYPEWMLSFMACSQIGCVGVPTNSLWLPNEIEYGMIDSGTTVAFVDGERAERLLPLCREGKVPGLRAVIVGRDANNVAAQGGGATRVLRLEEVMAASKGRKAPNVEVSPEDNALIMYTSGTTGNPKGVTSTHRNVVSALRNALFYPSCIPIMLKAAAAASGNKPKAAAPSSGGNQQRVQEAMICPVPLFHATGMHAIFLLSFLVGRKVVLMHKWDALEALKLIESEKVTGFTGVPTMQMELLDHPDYAKYDVSSLKSVGGGGAPPPKKLSSEASKKGKSAGQGWGLTESNALTVGTSSSKEYVANPASCGRALPLCDIQVVDDNNKELPPGSVGEILIRGPIMMKEYWNKPEATTEAISVDGWFRTGDVGKLDPDGALYIMDRAKDLIIRGGENISCAEVETAVYEHPSVQECSAFALPDERLGECVAVAVVRRQGAAAFTGPELEAFCAERLAKFKVPSQVFLWREGEQLPRGATGKIPKRTIRDQIKDGTAACTQILPPPAKM